MERFQSYPPWALAMCFSLIIVAMLPLPLVFIARHFNWIPDGSNKLSVSYRKSLAKEASTLEDETRFILGKNPSEAPSPMPSHLAYLGPGSTSPVELITNSTSISGYGSGYQTNPAPPKSESWSSKPPTRDWDGKRKKMLNRWEGPSVGHTLTQAIQRSRTTRKQTDTEILPRQVPLGSPIIHTDYRCWSEGERQPEAFRSKCKVAYLVSW